jgi:putative transposase
MNVLNKLPKSVQPKAKANLKDIWLAESRKDAEKAYDRFFARYGGKYDEAATGLAKDRGALLAFYDFPAKHWKHIRTGNPIFPIFLTRIM